MSFFSCIENIIHAQEKEQRSLVGSRRKEKGS